MELFPSTVSCLKRQTHQILELFFSASNNFKELIRTEQGGQSTWKCIYKTTHTYKSFACNNFKELIKKKKNMNKPAKLQGNNFARPPTHTVHPPQFDLPVVCSWDNQREGRVEGSPVNSPVMTLKDVFDDGIRCAEEISLARISQTIFNSTRSRGYIFLPQT